MGHVLLVLFSDSCELVLKNLKVVLVVTLVLTGLRLMFFDHCVVAVYSTLFFLMETILKSLFFGLVEVLQLTKLLLTLLVDRLQALLVLTFFLVKLRLELLDLLFKPLFCRLNQVLRVGICALIVLRKFLALLLGLGKLFSQQIRLLSEVGSRQLEFKLNFLTVLRHRIELCFFRAEGLVICDLELLVLLLELFLELVDLFVRFLLPDHGLAGIVVDASNHSFVVFLLLFSSCAFLVKLDLQELQLLLVDGGVLFILALQTVVFLLHLFQTRLQLNETFILELGVLLFALIVRLKLLFKLLFKRLVLGCKSRVRLLDLGQLFLEGSFEISPFCGFVLEVLAQALILALPVKK